MHRIFLNNNPISPLITGIQRDDIVSGLSSEEYVEIDYASYITLQKQKRGIKNTVYIVNQYPSDSNDVANDRSSASRIVGVTSLSALKVSITLDDEYIFFKNISGNIWINPNGDAVADETSFLLQDGDFIGLTVRGHLSIISDSIGAQYEYMVSGQGA
jgi:hypothetical protein